MSIIDSVLHLAKEKGVSQAFICNKLGLSRNYLSEVKKGKTKISDDRLSIIADILDTTPEYLKGETDVKEKPTGKSADGLSEYETSVLAWFRSLPPEKRAAILEIGDGPKEQPSPPSKA